MHKILALVRVNWLSSTSYRVSTVLSLFGLIASVVPLYFVANALQPLMADSIQSQGGQYFSFVLAGMVAFSFLPAAMSTLPGALGGSISSGTFEALTSTPTRLPTILTGMMGYNFCWLGIRAAILLVIGSLLGAQFVWSQMLIGAGIMVMIILAYVPIGLISAASVLAFRTGSPLAKGVLVLSALLGGVYYPTHVIPSWIESVSFAIPLTYGLRALRHTVLEGMPLTYVLPDLGILTAFVIVLFTGSAFVFAYALRYARVSGTLSQY
jgi:ABC-2 type transport system permease protein